MELEDETEMLVAEIAQFLGAEAAHIHAIYLYAATIRLVEGTDNLEKGGLSGTTRSDDTYHLALVNMQVDALEYLQEPKLFVIPFISIIFLLKIILQAKLSKIIGKA